MTRRAGEARPLYLLAMPDKRDQRDRFAVISRDLRPNETPFPAFLRLCVLAAAGGCLFAAAGLPAAWLSGAMVFVAVAGLARVRLAMPDQLTNALFVVLGISMGTGVQPEAFARIGEWPVSLAALLVSGLGSAGASYCVLRYMARWERETAFFGSIPGALSYVLVIAMDRGADMPKIATTQAFRLFVLVAVLPPFVSVSNGAMPDGGASAPASLSPELAFGVALCLAAAFAAQRAGIPAGWLTGAFFASACLNATGVMNFQVPGDVLVPCYVLLGAMIGLRFGQVQLSELKSLLAASTGAFAAGFSVAVLAAVLVSWSLSLPFGQVLLAYAPGGLEAMTLLSFLLNLDPAFVAAHQMVRYMLVVLLFPVVMHVVLGKSGRRT